MINPRVKLIAVFVIAVLALLLAVTSFFKPNGQVSKTANPLGKWVFRNGFFSENNYKPNNLAPKTDQVDQRLNDLINNEWEYQKIRGGQLPKQWDFIR
jgi:hypothetical protein